MSTPTKYSEINELLQQLLTQIQNILKYQFVSMYIGGSLASNNFRCETSDIDCYIITTSVLSKSLVNKIEAMHRQFYSSELKYVKKIEASYIPQKDLLHFDPNSLRPYFNEGCFYLAKYGSNHVIELYVLRENGITIMGPDIKRSIPEISTQDLRLAIKKNLYEYWGNILNDFSKLKRSDYQVFAILTMCRTIYSLETGRVTSKIEAAEWTKKFDPSWKDLIEQALFGNSSQELNRLQETQRFVRHVINKSHDY